jgi:exodeoxyribonuclease VIII
VTLKNEIMVDLETLDTSARAAIVSIGAVKFSLEDTIEHVGAIEPVDCFYRVVELDSSLRSGLEMSAKTIEWWMQQGERARSIFFNTTSKQPLPSSLLDFTKFCLGEAYLSTDGPAINMWGNGSDFDCAILAEAYTKTFIKKPWKFSNSRDYRTLKDFAKRFNPRVRHTLSSDKDMVVHNALEDAKKQTLLAQRYWRVIRGRPNNTDVGSPSTDDTQ